MWRRDEMLVRGVEGLSGVDQRRVDGQVAAALAALADEWDGARRGIASTGSALEVRGDLLEDLEVFLAAKRLSLR